MPSRPLNEIQIADQAVAGNDGARSPAGDDSQAGIEQTLDKNFALRREVDRLDELLSDDGNWRALAQLNEREIRGQPLERDLTVRLRSSLTEALASNRIYLARTKISEALVILDGEASQDEEAIQDGSAVLKGSVGLGGTAKTDDKVEKREVSADATRQYQIQQAKEANRSPFRTQVNVKSRTGTHGGEKDAASTSEAFVPEPEQSTSPVTADAPITTVSDVNGALDTGGIAAALVGGVALPVGFSVASSLKSDEPGQPDTSSTDVSSLPSSQETPLQPKQTSPDKLELIKGIDEQLAAGLNAAGVSRYEQIAQWTPANMSSISMQLNLHDRIARNNWIEQAAILATGETTAYARQASTGVRATLVPAPQPPCDVVGRKLFPRMAPVSATKAPGTLSVKAQPRAVELSTEKPPAVNAKPTTPQMLTPQVEALLAVKPPVVHPGEFGSEETGAIQSAVPATPLAVLLKSSAADVTARAPAEQSQPANEIGGQDGAATASAFPKSDYTGDFLNRPFVADPAAPSELQPIATADQEKPQLSAWADDELASDTSHTTSASPVSVSPVSVSPVPSGPVLTSTESPDRLPVPVDVPPASPEDSDRAAGQDEASLSRGATRALVPLLETLAVKSSAFDAPRRQGARPILAPAARDPESDQRLPIRRGYSARVLEETGKANGLADSALKVDLDVENADSEAMMQDGEGTNVDDEAVVMIIPRDSSASPAAMADTLLDTDRSRPALGRVKRDKEQRENPIESHAAYRMDADEASVTIVHHDGREEAPDLPFYKQNEHWEREGTIRKFLKALTGD